MLIQFISEMLQDHDGSVAILIILAIGFAGAFIPTVQNFVMQYI